MVYWNVIAILRSSFDAVIRPSGFVAAETSVYSATVRSRLRQSARLLLVYLMNVLLYAVPLSLAGVGVPETARTPALFRSLMDPIAANPEAVWRFTQAVASNSAYITAAAGLTFLTFHVGAVITFSSGGFVQSLHTVVYSTSAYLAGLFTTVWYLSTHEAVVAAREFVVALQAAFVYLHVGLLYEFAVWEMAQAGVLPETRGPVAVWLLVGAAFVAAIFAGLWYWRNVWVARVVWALHALRLPALIGGAFFPTADAALSPAFYTFAIVVVLINLGFLARAGWDL